MAKGEGVAEDDLIRYNHQLNRHKLSKLQEIVGQKPGKLQSMGSQKVNHDLVTEQKQQCE